MQKSKVKIKKLAVRRVPAVATLVLLFEFLIFNFALGQSVSLQPTGASLTYGSGTIIVKGAAQSITGSTLSGFAVSQNNCSLSAIFAGTDACEYIYYPGSGTALAHSNSLATAMPYVMGVATTDASGNVLSTGAPPFVHLGDQLLVANPISILAFLNCGTTTTCAQTAAHAHVVITGTVSMSSGTATITSLPFANANYRCWGSDNTSSTVVRFTGKTNSQMTINAASSDSVDYICIGKKS